jgi:hypothetical protein
MVDRHAPGEQAARYDSVSGAENTGLRLNNKRFFDDL